MFISCILFAWGRKWFEYKYQFIFDATQFQECPGYIIFVSIVSLTQFLTHIKSGFFLFIWWTNDQHMFCNCFGESKCLYDTICVQWMLICVCVSVTVFPHSFVLFMLFFVLSIFSLHIIIIIFRSLKTRHYFSIDTLLPACSSGMLNVCECEYAYMPKPFQYCILTHTTVEISIKLIFWFGNWYWYLLNVIAIEKTPRLREKKRKRNGENVLLFRYTAERWRHFYRCCSSISSAFHSLYICTICFHCIAHTQQWQNDKLSKRKIEGDEEKEDGKKVEIERFSHFLAHKNAYKL